jgi:hypothetical protein
MATGVIDGVADAAAGAVSHTLQSMHQMNNHFLMTNIFFC